MDFGRTEDLIVQPQFFWSLTASIAIGTDGAQHIPKGVRISKQPRI